MQEVTPGIVAQWMRDEFDKNQSLDQAHAVSEISRRFGPEFSYLNDNGNPAIDKRVLTAFRKLTGETAVWDRWDKAWYKREATDGPGRQRD